jgi:hypothetical protein
MRVEQEQVLSVKTALDKMFADYLGKIDTTDYNTPPNVDPAPPIKIKLHTGYIQVSKLLEQRVTRPDAPRAPWRRRARWRWQEWRERTGRRIGGWIAGIDLTEYYDE